MITGVSRWQAIGCAIAKRLAARGADLFLTHYRPRDVEQPWGADDIDAMLAELAEHRADPAQRVADLAVDLAEPAAPDAVIAKARATFGRVDILVSNHARSGGDGALGELTAEMLDAHWAENARSTLLLVQAFTAHHDGRPGGRVIMMTSGQGLGPLPGEVAYGAAKAALAGITLTLADQLAEVGITGNTLNPGPVDTGYVTADMAASVAAMFLFGRWGEPDDPARLIEWLVGDDGRWMTGQVLNSEGGFARWRASSA